MASAGRTPLALARRADRLPVRRRRSMAVPHYLNNTAARHITEKPMTIQRNRYLRRFLGFARWASAALEGGFLI